ncbi:MAG: hypothetical protein ACRDC5_05680, partial [Vibrio sp.]
GFVPKLQRIHPSCVPSWSPYYFLYSGNAAKSKPKARRVDSITHDCLPRNATFTSFAVNLYSTQQ